jgi:hypothetical protein
VARVHHLLHRVTAIGDRTEFARLDKLIQVLNVGYGVPGRDRKLRFLVARATGPDREKQILESVGCEVCTTGFTDPRAA